jgi:phosphate transport system substrate-binding protein
MLGASGVAKDSTGKEIKLDVLFDRKNSSVMHYLMDSVLKGEKFAPHCRVLESTQESINYVAKNKNAIAFIDFAWLSDVDDSIYKANNDKIKFIAVGKTKACLTENGTYKDTSEKDSTYEYPSPSTFKLGTYPYTRTIYVYRRSGEFTLGKGFESFVSGPKGQVTFLKQGLLPLRQQERMVKVNFEPIKTN